MTTIAFDGKVLAGDTLSTSGETIVSHSDPKIFKSKSSKKYYCFGICGNRNECLSLMRWLDSKNIDCTERPHTKDGDGTVLAITHDGEAHLYHYNEFIDYELVTELPFAMGSGRRFALGAMDGGIHAFQAVLCAINRDIWTGGKVLRIDVTEKGKSFDEADVMFNL